MIWGVRCTVHDGVVALPRSLARFGLLLALLSCRPGITEPARQEPQIDPRTLLIWRDSTSSGNVRPVYDATSVYHFNFRHQVSAVDKETGALRWKRTLVPTEPFRNGAGLLIAGSVLVVGDRDLVGIDRVTGAVLWNFKPSVGGSAGFVRQTTDGVTVFCGSTTGHAYAVDGATGTERWAVQIAIGAGRSVGVYDPVLKDSVVYVGYMIDTGLRGTSGVAAIDARTGTLLWRTHLPDDSPSDPSGAFGGVAVAGDFVVAPSGDGSVYGLVRSTGAVHVRIPRAEFDPTPRTDGAEIRDVFAIGDRVFLTSTEGYLTALATSDLRRLWRVYLNRGSPTDVVADETHVFTTHLGGQVTVSRVSDGSRVWIIDRGTFRADGQEEILAGPAMEGDRLYFGGGNEVYALKRN
jgi:outer membrane protein assembly factor BamB